MRSIAVTLAAAALTVASGATHAQEKYTMEDLEALMAQESWIEILDHATDIRPSKRGKKWSRFLETAAIGHITAVKDTGDEQRALTTAEELLVKHPILKRSREYMTARGRVGLDALAECFRENRNTVACSERLETFVKVDPTNDNLAFEAGKLSRLRGSAYVATRLFAMAFKKRSRRVRCGDEQVWLAVDSVLSNARHEPTRAAARKIAFDYCFAPLKDEIMDRFLSAGTGYLASTCPDLGSRGLLSAFQLALCEESQ